MKFRITMGALLVLALPLSSLAEDIDLFLGSPPADSQKPNVLIILDNTANWNTAFTNEKQAIVDTFLNMDPEAFNVGLMLYGESPNLGYVRAAIRPMSDTKVIAGTTYTYNQLYAEMINDFDVNGDKGNARTLARTFAEVYRYLNGANSVDTDSNNGYGKNINRDFKDNLVGTLASQRVHSLEGNAFDASNDFSYTAPPQTGSCAKTYVIYIGNNVPGGNVSKDNNARNAAAKTDLDAAAASAGISGASTLITSGYTYTSHQDNYADEWARFMHDQDDVIFYAVDVNPTPHPEYDGTSGHNNGMGSSELLRSFSEGVGGGKYFRVTSTGSEIADELAGILTEIQAVNSVFASVALPASTTGQSVFLNQVFIGLFRPDGSAYPRWPGNLKQYQLGRSGGTVKLFDAKDELAINPTTGFISECARSFWTSATQDTYWDFFDFPDESVWCGANDTAKAASEASNSPDGPYVEKGAQAFMLRAQAPTSRIMFTCDQPTTSCTSRTSFNDANSAITQALLGASDATERTTLIDWARGADQLDENEDTILTTTRASVHGDVIHSQPVALNYGTDLAPSVVAFYGGNDGALRAVNGNQQDDAVTTDNISGFVPGAEIWSFMPPEFWGQIARLRDNTEIVKFPATGPNAGVSGSPKPYGMDGPLTAYEGDIGGFANQKYLYAGMRRGGRAIYAFNVTDPDDPVLLWKRGCDSTTCSTPTGSNSWADIGQTWSPANVANATGHSNPVLIMGGGYDPCEDYDGGAGSATHSCDTTEPGDKGDKIYVIDAANGDLLKVFDTERAVPGGVTLVPATNPTDEDPNPALAFAYATDTGGNIYRISGDDGSGGTVIIGSTAPSTWIMTKIASFGCGEDAADTCTANRKFLFGPDVVRSQSDPSVFRILVGSGDREKPLLDYSGAADVQNYFFSFVDQPLVADWLEDDDDGTCGEDIICRGRLLEVSSITEEGATVDPTLKGYVVRLDATEQVVTSTLVVGDVAYFSTHTPYNAASDADADVCENKLGTAFTYNIGFENAGGEKVYIIPGGLVPSPVAGLVQICENGNCTNEPFCIGCGGENSPIGGGTPSSGSGFEQSKGRVYWNVVP
jgi:type IV pilus assembly protein PilY1